MKNILMIGPSRKVHGGISAVVNNLFEAGLDKEFNLKYIGTMEEGSKFHKLMVAGKAYIQFYKELDWADVVHVNVASDSSFWRKSFFIKKAHKVGKRIIIHQHGGNFENYYRNTLKDGQRARAKKTFSFAERLLVLSPKDKAFFSKIVDESRILVVPNSIKIPAKTEKDFTSHKALFLGRICKTKGISELLKAADILHEQYPDFSLYLGGIYEDSSYKSEVEKRSEYVNFLGWIDSTEKEKYLSECDIFVLPTYFEGQPVSVLEAMAHSCVVVASNVGGIPMMIEDGVNGVLVEPKSVNSLVAGLDTVLRDASLSKKYANRAYIKVSNDYSIANTVEMLVSIYEK